MTSLSRALGTEPSTELPLGVALPAICSSHLEHDSVVRLAAHSTDFWQLRSGEEAHRSNPATFWIPPLAERQGLERGQAAKLIFELEGIEEDGSVGVMSERMWVIVAERVGDLFVGVLDNQPAFIEITDSVYLRFGAEVPFGPEHVIDISEPPEDYARWQLGQPPERVWPRA
jgi:hypothetical protein